MAPLIHPDYGVRHRFIMWDKLTVGVRLGRGLMRSVVVRGVKWLASWWTALSAQRAPPSGRGDQLLAVAVFGEGGGAT